MIVRENFSRVQWYSCTYMKLLKKSYILMKQVVLKEIRKFYTWSKKGKKAYIVSPFDNLTLSMWFAFSKLRFYGVWLHQIHSIQQNSYFSSNNWFIRDKLITKIWALILLWFVTILNIHKTREVDKFLKEKGV